MTQRKNLQKFERFLNANDFGIDDTTLVNGAFTRIGEVEIGAQTLATFGAGAIANGVDFRRNINIDLQDVGGDINNVRVRLKLANANETRTTLIAEELSENIRLGVPLAEFNQKGVERDKLIVEVFNGTGADIDMLQAGTALSVPTTIYQ